MVDADFLYRCSPPGLIRLFQLGKKPTRNGCPTKRNDSSNDLKADDRKNAGYYRLCNPGFTGPFHKGVIKGVVKEQLRYGKVRPVVEFQFQIGEISLKTFRLGVY